MSHLALRSAPPTPSAIIELLKPLGITEIVRTGRVAMWRGTRTLAGTVEDEKEKVA